MFVGGIPRRSGGTRGTNVAVKQRDETVNVGDRIEINCEVTGMWQL